MEGEGRGLVWNLLNSKLVSNLSQTNWIIWPNFRQFDWQESLKKGHSTIHQLVRIKQEIKRNFSHGKSTGMVLLDVEKAYDSVWQEAVVFKLHQSNCPLYLVKIISSFLSNRRFEVTLNGSTSTSHPIPFGVPQGSVLSPTLYNIFTSDTIMVDGVVYAFFADDTAF